MLPVRAPSDSVRRNWKLIMMKFNQNSLPYVTLSKLFDHAQTAKKVVPDCACQPKARINQVHTLLIYKWKAINPGVAHVIDLSMSEILMK
jgi:hypothetical protein